MPDGRVCRVHEETIERYTMGRLTGSSLVQFEEHLLICERCQCSTQDADFFIKAIRTAIGELVRENRGRERRREPRRTCRRPVEIRVPNMGRRVVARATDISRSGLGLTIGVHIRTGARVILAIGARRYEGEVAWCAPQGVEYRAGIRLAA